MTKLKDKKKKRIAKRRKPRWNNGIKELLIEKGKSEKWFEDELEKHFKINKSVTKNLIEGYEYLSVTTYRLQVCLVLGVRLGYFDDIPRI